MAIYLNESMNGVSLKDFIKNMTNQYLNTAETHIIDFRKAINIGRIGYSSVNGGHPFNDLEQDLALTDYVPISTPKANKPLTKNGITTLGEFLNELQVAAIKGYLPEITYIPIHKSQIGKYNAKMINNIPPYLTIVVQPSDKNVDETKAFTLRAVCDRPEASWELFKVGTADAIATGHGIIAHYTIDEATLDDAGEYSFTFKEDALVATSRTATVTVKELPLVVTVQPVDKSVKEGEAYSFSSTCNYTTATWGIFNGETSVSTGNGAVAEYTKDVTTLDDAGNYSAEFKHGTQTVSSSVATLSITEPTMTVIETSADVSVNTGQNITVSAKCSRSNVTWELKRGAEVLATGSGAEATKSVQPAALAHTGAYQFTFISPQQQVKSRVINVTVKAAPFSAAFSTGFGS